MSASPVRVLRLTAALGIAGLPAVVWHDGLARAAALWPLAGDTATPFITGHGALLLAVPLLALSATLLFLAPGLLLALLSRRAASSPGWVLSAVPLALAAAALLVGSLRRWSGTVPPGGTIGIATLFLTVVTGGLVAWLATRRALAWPLVDRRASLPLAAAACTVLIATACFLPKLLWESFNGDGAHAFEVSRLLLHQPWPFFPASAGDIAGFPGPTSMLFTWPNAWFLGLLGPIDAAVRLPFVIYLPLLLLGLQAIAEVNGRPLGGRTIAALGIGIVPFVLAMAFSASYEPYHADLALPGVQDLLLLLLVAGFVHAMLRREPGWAIAFGVLAHLTLPNGLVLIGCWLVAELVVMRPVPWRALATGTAVIAACLAVGAAIPLVVAATGHPSPGDEYGFARAIDDLLRISPLEGRRLLWLLVGAGIVPVFAMGWWRRQDDAARRLTVLVVLYYLFFHVQARVALHHFAPAMVFPLAVAARLRPPEARHFRWYVGAWVAAAVVASVLAAPRSLAIHTASRTVGSSVHQRVGDYAVGDPKVFAAAGLLSELLPPAWHGSVPDRSYGGSPLAWIRYASDSITSRTAYLLVAAGERTTADSAIAAEGAGARLLVLDRDAPERHRALRPGTDARSPVFAVPRATLFGPGGPRTVALGDRLRSLFR